MSDFHFTTEVAPGDHNGGGALDLLKMDTNHDGIVDYRTVSHDTGHAIPNNGNGSSPPRRRPPVPVRKTSG